jgi:glycogen debranching enzyme
MQANPDTRQSVVDSAYALLERSIISYDGEPVGTAAACDPSPVAANYTQCFIRDFVPSALVFLMNGRAEVVRNFLLTSMRVRKQQHVMPGHQRSLGLMPASFHIVTENDASQIVADFGDRAIGRVTPVDSAMWWVFLLRAYVIATDDWALLKSNDIQECLRNILDLYLRERFESSPTLLVPDGSFMIDRRMAVNGYPLEIQALYYGMLRIAGELLRAANGADELVRRLDVLSAGLRDYVRAYYWIDRGRLNEIHRYYAEEFGLEVANVLNVYPESIPDWMDGWLDAGSGYLVGNQGPGRIDFRFFSQGNLLAVLFGLATKEESRGLMNLFQLRWDELIGEMPVKLVFPAVTGKEWMFATGSDPKNTAWSYHNGGNWPALIWPFVGAALRCGRNQLAERALNIMCHRIAEDDWPEYYDGKRGGLIGRRANFFHTWSAAGLLVAHELLSNPQHRALFDRMTATAS